MDKPKFIKLEDRLINTSYIVYVMEGGGLLPSEKEKGLKRIIFAVYCGNGFREQRGLVSDERYEQIIKELTE